MSEIRDFFIKTLDDSHSGINYRLRLLMERLHHHDPHLAVRLKLQQLQPQYFAFRSVMQPASWSCRTESKSATRCRCGTQSVQFCHTCRVARMCCNIRFLVVHVWYLLTSTSATPAVFNLSWVENTTTVPIIHCHCPGA